MQEFMVRMFLFLAITTPFSGVFGLNLLSIPVRLMCFKDFQANCNEECTSAYPHLNWATNNVTQACTWFLLFTRRNPDQPELLHKCGGKLPPNTNFNPDSKLVLIINAYRGGYCNESHYRHWKHELLLKGDYNVLILDWAWGSIFDYYSATQNAKIAGKQAVIVLENIQKQIKPRLQIHIVGNSIANSVSAQIGLGIRVDRITALDPAHPAYPESAPLSERLDPSDAKLVEVWHTNAGDCIPWTGLPYDAGHIDYYINGGSKQPMCNYIAPEKNASLIEFLIHAFDAILHVNTCSHAAAEHYFTVSINPDGCQFIGVKCSNKNLIFEDNEEDLGISYCA